MLRFDAVSGFGFRREVVSYTYNIIRVYSLVVWYYCLYRYTRYQIYVPTLLQAKPATAFSIACCAYEHHKTGIVSL